MPERQREQERHTHTRAHAHTHTNAHAQVVLGVKDSKELLKFAKKLEDAGMLHRMWIHIIIYTYVNTYYQKHVII